jgi:hypothetical protein
MKYVLNVILCLLIGTTVVADDGPESGAKPVQGKTAKKPDLNPFAKSDPFGAPIAKNRDDKNTGKTSPTAIPFGFKVGQEDPFVQQERAKANVDPFDAPNRTKRASGAARLVPIKPEPRPQRAAVTQIPSITLEASSESRARIESQLGRETKVDYLDTPLKDVIDDIALRHGIPIIINVSALEDFGIGTDTPITISLDGVRLRSALKLMLRELELTFIIKDEVMQITTPEEAEANLYSRFYSVSILLPATGDGDYLLKLIQKHVAPDSWDAVGGPGAITFVQHLETLVVTQSEEVLHEIDILLASVAKLNGLSRQP